MNATLESQLTGMLPALVKATPHKDWMGGMSEGDKEAVMASAKLGAALHFAFREASRLTKMAR